MIHVTDNTRRVAIIGGGITGLSAAFYLQEQAKLHHYPLEIVLLEGSHRLGGKLQTLRKDGFIIERGPDSFIDRNHTVLDLATKLGIDHDLVQTANAKTYIAVNNKELQPVPKNTILGIPTQIKPFMASNLVSWSGKVRATADWILPPSRIDGDQSLGKFMRRRFGEEFVQNLIEPFLSGVFSGDIDELSLQATLPTLLQYEQETGSVMRGMRRELTSMDPRTFTEEHNAFSVQTFTNGMDIIVDALADAFNGQLMKGVRVQSIKKSNDRICLALNNKSKLLVDGVVIATPHQAAQKLFSEQQLLQDLKNIPSNTVASVSMIFKDETLPEFDGTDVYMSRNSDYSLTSVTNETMKFPHIAPKGYTLLNCYIGRTGDAAIVELSDSEIEKTVIEDLKQLSGVTEQPVETVVSRWKDSMPQYTIGHIDRIKHAKKELYEAFPTVRLAGNSYEGISLPKCIEQGMKNAEELLDELFK